MIPKVIHYCWIGGKPLPAKMKACIASWRRLMPDAEIREWNESNYDFRQVPFMDEAYRAKKWGFVPDYARLDIIYRHGGIYLDTDVEMLKPLDAFLENRAFCGFENAERVNFGQVFAAEPGHPLIGEMRQDYVGRHFSTVPSPVLQTEILKRHGLQPDAGRVQELDGLRVYPKDYFAPRSYEGDSHFTVNTCLVHHFEASWVPLRWRITHGLRKVLEPVLGPALMRPLVALKRRIWPEYV